jgi:hypothetical protein
MAAVTAGLRLAEQVLFVFVASLWPNAVGGVGAGEGREVFERFEVPAPPPVGEGGRREAEVEGEAEDEGDEEGAEEERRREGQQERREQVIV